MGVLDSHRAHGPHYNGKGLLAQEVGGAFFIIIAGRRASNKDFLLFLPLYGEKCVILQRKIFIRYRIMCRFNLSFNDAVVDEMRPHFADEKAMLMWMQAGMERMMREYTAQFSKKTAIDGKELLRKLQAIPNTPEGFLQLGGILGKPEGSFSWDDLREDAYAEKYGI